MSDFPCTRCGACCRVAGAVPELVDFARKDGVCMWLTPENTCAIYDDRPRICRVRDMRPEVMTVDEWHRRNEQACDRLHLMVYGQPRLPIAPTPESV